MISEIPVDVIQIFQQNPAKELFLHFVDVF
ncbi:hypothetical protein E2320_002669, partial [Naja naja]